MTATLQTWHDNWHSNQGRERSFRVRWLLNPNETPLENVDVVEQDGLITALRCGKSGSGNILPAVLIPTLVNAHTHLEFSSLSEPIRPAHPFQDWISAVIHWRRHTAVSDEMGVQRGLQESRQNGVSVLGEITTTKPVSAGILPAGSEVVSFREIIGLQPERFAELMQLAEQHLLECSTKETDNQVICGLSPHAPYTVHPQLFESLIDLAVRRNVAVAMHLAETTDELELLHDGGGRFAGFLQSLGLWDADVFPGGRSIRDFLERLAAAPRALAIHGNYFSDDDIRFVAGQHNIATVYCPRTHQFFGHKPHPIRQLIAAGARVVLGTDSRASNPDLNLWRELQFVATHFPEIPVQRLLAMVTTDAADAMGRAAERQRILLGGKLRGVLLNAEGQTNDLRSLIRHPSTQPAVVLF